MRNLPTCHAGGVTNPRPVFDACATGRCVGVLRPRVKTTSWCGGHSGRPMKCMPAEPTGNDCACFCAWKNRSWVPVSLGSPVGRTTYNIQKAHHFSAKEQTRTHLLMWSTKPLLYRGASGFEAAAKIQTGPTQVPHRSFIPRASPLAQTVPDWAKARYFGLLDMESCYFETAQCPVSGSMWTSVFARPAPTNVSAWGTRRSFAPLMTSIGALSVRSSNAAAKTSPLR